MVEFCKHTGPKLVFVIPPNAENDVLAYFQDGRKLTAQRAAPLSS